MDTPFSASQWQPSKPFEEWEPPPSDLAVSALIQALNHQTLNITNYPYDPRTWLTRANTLAQLRYPELAVGDAQKASMLCQNLLAALNRRPRCRLGYRTGFLMTNADDENDDHGTEERIRQQEVTFGSLLLDAPELLHENLVFYPTFKKGRIILRQYPWLPERHLMRTDEVIQGLNRDLVHGAKSIHGSQCCVVKRYAFGHGVGARDGEDLLGVFATRRILKNQNILKDISRTWGCNGPEASDTNRKNSYLPYEDLDEDLLWIRNMTGKSAASTILRCRLLICAVTDGATHPLDHPLIARLTPTYRPDQYNNFSMDRDINVFNRVLQQFGIDIFANLNWDTYTFFTIMARVGNNSWSSPNTETINTLFSMFNHSCEANVEWQASPDNRTIVMKADRDIERGEQLFVCYDGFIADQPLEARRKRFSKWINGPCQCSKCLREEQAFGRSGESSPTCSFSSESSGDWDVDEKPVFPEDSFVCETNVDDEDSCWFR